MSTITLTLQALAPSRDGQRWELLQRARVGRLPYLEVALDDASLSRVHAEIVPEQRGWALYDLGSTNGTCVNGERLGRSGVYLRAHDVLQFGDVMLTITNVGGKLTPSCQAPPCVATARATVLLTWNRLRDAFASESRARVEDLLLQLARIGRFAVPHDSLDGYLHAVLWQAGETVDAAQGVIALAGEREEWGWYARVSESFGPALNTAIWSRPGLLRGALGRQCSGLYDSAVVPDGESTSMILALLRVGDQPRGVLGLARSPDAPPFTEQDLLIADAVALAASASIQSVVHHYQQQERQLLKTLTAMTQLVQLRDDHTASHAQRVTDYALLLANRLGGSEAEKHCLRIGTPLHDLGKIGVSDAILTKSGPLTAEEMRTFRDNVLQASQVVEQLPSLSPLVPIVRNCRERWDGAGFPDGLRGARIPLVARIVAVADAFDSMLTDQPYRSALSLPDALEQLRAGAGTQFDPACVEAFLQLRGEVEESLRQRRQSTTTMSVAQLREKLAKMGRPTAAQVPARR